MGGGLALDRGVDGEDDLVNAAGRDTGNQLPDAKILRADAVERRQRAAQHVIARVDDRGALQRPEIGNVLDDDDGRRIPPRILADGAGIAGVDVAAGRADDDRIDGDVHGLRQRDEKLVLLLDEMERGAAGRSRPKAGKF
jgi:hypothetical protein